MLLKVTTQRRLGSLLTEDGEWTDVIGYTMIGRNEIEHQLSYPFTTVLKEAKPDVKSYRSKWITDQIVSVDIKWESNITNKETKKLKSTSSPIIMTRPEITVSAR